MRLIWFLLLLSSTAIVAAAQSDIRKADFKNFTYSAYCAGEEPENVTVKDGEFSSEKQEDGYVDRFYFNVFGISYGDLNADKKDEAVVLTVCNTGGTGNFTEGFIFGMKAGKPTLLARIPGGDRAYGGLRESRVVNGSLVVESNDVGEMGGACCPEFIVTTKYRLSGAKIVKIGVPTRREVIPTQRVTFARGTSGKTFTTEIAAGDAKQFIVGARAGQTLTVSLNTDQASLRLIDDTEVTPGINNFTAKLARTGDYTFAIENNATSSLKITVNVKIR